MSIENKITKKVKDVPRSGSSRMRATGTKVTIKERRSICPSLICGFEISLEITKIVNNFASSEGWKFTGPKLNHLWEPLISGKKRTKINKSIVKIYIGKIEISITAFGVFNSKNRMSMEIMIHINCLI